MPDAVAGRWANAVVRFNLDPAEYADPSWLPRWAPHASQRVRSELSRGLLREQGLEACHDWELPATAARLFMMDRSALGRVALAVGIASHRDSLRRVVRKEQLAALRECLGAASPTLWLGVAEEVPRSAVALAVQWETFDASLLVDRLTRTGKVEMLRMLDAREPAQRPAALRAAFCLPRAAFRCDSPHLAPLPAPHAARMAQAIVADLIDRVEPEWTWLF